MRGYHRLRQTLFLVYLSSLATPCHHTCAAQDTRRESINREDLASAITNGVAITHRIILADDLYQVDISNATSFARVELEDCEIVGNVHHLSKFTDLLIRRTIFHGDTHFFFHDESIQCTIEDSIFEGVVVMTGLREGDNIALIDSEFKGNFSVTNETGDAQDATDQIYRNYPFGGLLSIVGCSFKGSRAAFKGAVLERLDFSSLLGMNPSPLARRSTVFECPVIFDDISSPEVNAQGALFHKPVLIRRCRFGFFGLADTICDEDVVFSLTTFSSGLCAEDAVFVKGWRLEWNSVVLPSRWPKTLYAPSTWIKAENAVTPTKQVSASSWKNLEEAWRFAKNTEAANEAMYRWRVIEEPASWQRWLWGYGVRPWRCALWMVVLVCACAACYWTQTEGVGSKWKRITFAMRYSVRAAWEWRFAMDNARSTAWKMFGLGEQTLFKLLGLLWLQALANTTPFLHEIMQKFVPL